VYSPTKALFGPNKYTYDGVEEKKHSQRLKTEICKFAYLCIHQQNHSLTLLYKKAFLCNPFSFSIESQQACRVHRCWKPGQAQKIMTMYSSGKGYMLPLSESSANLGHPHSSDGGGGPTTTRR
jgi:hypothetical protein